MEDNRDLVSEAKRMIDIYDSSDRNIDFTIYMSELEHQDHKLWLAIGEELRHGDYSVKILRGYGG